MRYILSKRWAGVPAPCRVLVDRKKCAVRLLPLVLISLTSLAMSACGTQTDSDGTVAESVTDRPVKEWNVLASDFNGLVEALQAYDGREPKTASEVSDTVGYEFSDSVALTRWDPKAGSLCLVGEADTYLSLSTVNGGTFQRTLGTGPCDPEDGDIVLVLTDPEPNASTVVQSAAKNTATAIETLAVDNPGSTDPLTPQTLTDADWVGWSLPKGVRVVEMEGTLRDGYHFCVADEAGTYATYDSTQGGLMAIGTNAECSYEPGETAPTDGPDEPYENAVKGEDLVALVPALADNPLLLMVGDN